MPTMTYTEALIALRQRVSDDGEVILLVSTHAQVREALARIATWLQARAIPVFVRTNEGCLSVPVADGPAEMGSLQVLSVQDVLDRRFAGRWCRAVTTSDHYAVRRLLRINDLSREPYGP